MLDTLRYGKRVRIRTKPPKSMRHWLARTQCLFYLRDSPCGVLKCGNYTSPPPQARERFARIKAANLLLDDKETDETKKRQARGTSHYFQMWRGPLDLPI